MALAGGTLRRLRTAAPLKHCFDDVSYLEMLSLSAVFGRRLR